MEKPRFSKSCNNLSLYSGNHIGFLGGICEPTDVPGILIWDCLKTDWLHSKAYPTRLIYNPHDSAKQVTLNLTHPTDLYDLVTGQFIARGAETGYRVKLAADQVTVLVILPANAMAKYIDGQLLVNEVVVDYHPQRNR